jgi:hypothetical protein
MKVLHIRLSGVTLGSTMKTKNEFTMKIIII